MNRSMGVRGFIESIHRLECQAVHSMNGMSKSSAMQMLFSIVSRAGDGGIWVLVGLVLLLWDGSAALPVVLKMIIGFISGYLVYSFVKKMTGRVRPCNRHTGLRLSVEPLDEFSFPSGHTLHAVMLTILVTAYYPWFGVVLVPFTVLVALSRVVLGLHYPSDVVVGAIMGSLMSLVLLAF